VCHFDASHNKQSKERNPMSLKKFQLGFCMALITTVMCGCGGGPKLVQIKGVAKVDGTPTAGIQLTFHPADGKLPSSGFSEAGGEFTVVTDLNPGIPPGKYTVTANYPDPAVKISESQRMQGLGEPGPDLFKGKYGTIEKGVAVEITSSTSELPIELKLK
jgi:hypothetical protein